MEDEVEETLIVHDHNTFIDGMAFETTTTQTILAVIVAIPTLDVVATHIPES